ncbi:MAG: hypothetical protein ACLUVG_02550 [Phocaeicola vulgatus]
MGKEPDKSGKERKDEGKTVRRKNPGRVRVFSIQWLSRNWKNVELPD